MPKTCFHCGNKLGLILDEFKIDGGRIVCNKCWFKYYDQTENKTKQTHNSFESNTEINDATQRQYNSNDKSNISESMFKQVHKEENKLKRPELILLACVLTFLVFAIFIGLAQKSQSFSNKFATPQEKVVAEFFKAIEEEDAGAIKMSIIDSSYNILESNSKKNGYTVDERLKIMSRNFVQDYGSGWYETLETRVDEEDALFSIVSFRIRGYEDKATARYENGEWKVVMSPPTND